MTPTGTSDFFRIERTASEIKAELLEQYFQAWTAAFLNGQPATETLTPMLYIDLLAGQDNSKQARASLQVLRSLYKSTGTRFDLNQAVKTFFYDADKAAIDELKGILARLPFYQSLVHPPVMLHDEGNRLCLKQLLAEGHPAFIFLNPFGDDFSQEMLLEALHLRQSDLCMLFAPKEVEAAVKKAKADSPVQQLFGERLDQIKAFYKQNRNKDRREEQLLNSFEGIFQSQGLYTLQFKINLPDKKQASHYVVLTSKSEQAHIRQKELMQRYSDYQEDGVPLLGANMQAQQTTLFHEHYRFSIANLVQDLTQQAAAYNNRPLQHIYELHSLGTPYTLENYKTAYEKLMRRGNVRFINPKTGQLVTRLTPASLVRYT